MPLYQIKDWDAHFENDRSRNRIQCSFVCVPNKQHGMGFCRIMAEPDGAAIYGIWHCIVGACSQQRKRYGWLTSDGDKAVSGWGVEDLALKFRRPESEIARALEVLCSEKVGWIIDHENTLSHRQVTAKSPPTHAEGKKEEKEEKEGIGARASVEEVLKAAGKVAEKLRVPEQAGLTDTQADINLTALQRIEEKLNSVYRRPKTQRWDCDEEQQLVQVSKRDGVLDEMAHIFYFRSQMPSDERRRFFPQSVRALLNNWGPTLDKARVQCPRPSEKKAVPKQHPNLKPFEPSKELAEKFRKAATI